MFYPRWVAANAWAEAVGLGTTLLLGRAAAPAMERVSGAGAIVLGGLAAVALGLLLEGVLVGWAQARVLRSELRNLSSRSWIAATAAGAGAAWLLGMVPSTVFALLQAGAAGPTGPTAEPPAGAQYALAVILGAITGPVLGAGQWLVLRRHAKGAGRWILANAAAWAAGMLVIFIGMDLVPWTRGGPPVVLGVYLVCAAAGLVVGSIHGRVLLRLIHPLRDPGRFDP